jgi:hypothetical protein
LSGIEFSFNKQARLKNNQKAELTQAGSPTRAPAFFIFKNPRS